MMEDIPQELFEPYGGPEDGDFEDHRSYNTLPLHVDDELDWARRQRYGNRLAENAARAEGNLLNKTAKGVFFSESAIRLSNLQKNKF